MLYVGLHAISIFVSAERRIALDEIYLSLIEYITENYFAYLT